MAKSLFEELGGRYERQGSTLTLPTLTDRHRNALKGS